MTAKSANRTKQQNISIENIIKGMNNSSENTSINALKSNVISVNVDDFVNIQLKWAKRRYNELKSMTDKRKY